MAFPLDRGLQLDTLWSSGDLDVENSIEDPGVSRQLISTRSPWKSPSGSGVARCSSFSRLVRCSSRVREFVFSVTLRSGHGEQAMGPPLTLLVLWSLVTFIPSRPRLSSPESCSRGGIWTWLHSSSFHRRRGLDLDLCSQCALYPACSQLSQPVSADFGPTTP